MLAIDFLVYYPFFKVYDREKCEEEAAMLEEELAAEASAKSDAMTAAFQGKINASSVADDDSKTQAAAADSNDLAKLNGRRVLVLCQGGGTSGLLANALAKAAKEHGIDLETGADAYGNHVDMMKDFDLVILAPQAASYFDDLKADCDRMGLACCITRGKQYIDLTRDGEPPCALWPNSSTCNQTIAQAHRPAVVPTIDGRALPYIKQEKGSTS